MAAPIYKGTYQFTNYINATAPTWFDASGRAVNCPFIQGGSSLHYWIDVEGAAEGTRDWSKYDADINAWAATNKKTILRLSVGGNNFDSSAINATPAWVYNTYGVPSVTESDGSILPQYWNATFESKYQNLINAFAAKYDGNPNVAAIQIGIGCGGETLCDQLTGSTSSPANPSVSIDQHRRDLWYTAGYSDAVWWSYLQWVVNAYCAAFTHTPLIVMCDLAPFLGNQPYGAVTLDNSLVAYDRARVLNWTDTLTNPGTYNQMNKLTNTQTLSSYWYKNGANVPLGLIAEQYNTATSNGRTLLGDVQNGITLLLATWILLYGGDLIDANLAVPGQPGGLTPSATSAASLTALQWALNQCITRQDGNNAYVVQDGSSYNATIDGIKYSATKEGVSYALAIDGLP